MNNEITYWAGTEQSLHALMEADKSADMSVLGDKYAASVQASMDNTDEDEEDHPRLLEKQGSIGVISVAGPLVNSDSWINMFMGRTGYPEIREALVYAAQDPEIKAIVLDVKSGGGEVSGVADTSALIKLIDKQVKPVHAFSDGMAASAAYWLASSARDFNVGSVAEVGSIGILMVHREMSKAMEMNGVKATVMKAGKHKAEGNPYEPLSASAKESIQGQLDYLYALFVQAVAENRGVPYQTADQNMANGKVFIGQQAVDAGLADGVSTFDAFLSKLQREIDFNKTAPQYGGSFGKEHHMATALTEQQIAAMAAGVVTQAAAPTTTQDAAPAATAEQPAAPAEPTPVAEQPTQVSAEPSLVDFLKTSLAEAQAQVIDLTMQLREAKSTTEKAEANRSALRVIVEASLSNLKVALGGSAVSGSDMTDDAILAEHASLRAQFESKFKAGGVAAVAPASSEKSVSEVDPIRQARLKSTRLA